MSRIGRTDHTDAWPVNYFTCEANQNKYSQVRWSSFGLGMLPNACACVVVSSYFSQCCPCSLWIGREMLRNDVYLMHVWIVCRSFFRQLRSDTNPIFFFRLNVIRQSSCGFVHYSLVILLYRMHKSLIHSGLAAHDWYDRLAHRNVLDIIS